MNEIPQEQRAIHERCFHPTGTFVPFVRDELEQSIADRFQKIVRLYPKRVAVKTSTHELTYDQLNRMANRIGHLISAVNYQPKQPVAVMVGSSAPWIACVLGVLKSGNWFITLDPSHPRARIAGILESSESRIIVTDEENSAFAKDLAGIHSALVNIDGSAIRVADTNMGRYVPADSVACLLYTSGSTGTPKGVVRTHRVILHQAMSYTNCFHVAPQDRLSSLGSLATGQTLSNFLLAELAGATLCRYDVRREGLAGLSSWLNGEGITIFWTGVPTFRHFLKTVEATGVPAVRLVRLASDQVTRNDFELFKQHFSSTCILANGLSITESGIAALYLADQQTRIEGSFVPIGYPVRDKEILLLDDSGRESDDIAVGEIAVRSRYLAPGYWRNPELTRTKFRNEGARRDQRVYRTGDRAQRSPDGSFIHLGRKDFQVKIRGFTVDASEIESALLEHTKIREALVTGVKDPKGERRLVAYLVPEITPLSLATLREFLLKRLPDHMIPSTFVVLEEFPLNQARKVDRTALPEPDWTRRTAEKAFADPRDAVEAELADIFRETLGIERVGIFDDLFELGGHSLVASQVAQRIFTRFAVELPVRLIFEQPTVADLAKAITAERGGTRSIATSIPLVPRDQKLPLSFAQERLWFLDQLQPADCAYNLFTALELTGNLNRPALQQSIKEIVSRHEVLRTVFQLIDHEPVQVILPKVDAGLPYIDLTAIHSAATRAAAEDLARAFARKHFQLDKGPLIRTILIGLAPHRYLLCLGVHHAVFDVVSGRVFFRELSQLYRAYCNGQPSPLVPPKLQYADFAQWQRLRWSQNVPDAMLEYWLQKLTPVPPALHLPTDRMRPPHQGSSGARYWFTVDSELLRTLRALSQQTGTTLFMTLLAAYSTLLYHYSGQEDLVVGCPVSERNRRETEELIGLFLNTLPVRMDLSGEPTFVELLGRVKATCLEAYSNSDVPFEKLVQELSLIRDTSRHPLFQVLFSLSLGKEAVASAQLDGIEAQRWDLDIGVARFDLAMILMENGDALRGAIDYNLDLLDSPTIQRMAEHFQNLLRAIALSPHQRISMLSLLSETERNQLAAGRNGSLTEHSRNQTVCQMFEEQVERTPEATAAVFENQHIVRRELNIRANRLAHYLRSLGVGPESLVGICLERSLEMVVALLGVLKAGGAYVPLDPSYPRERLTFMVQDSGMTVLVTQASLQRAFSGQHSVISSQHSALSIQQKNSRTPGDARRTTRDAGQPVRSETASVILLDHHWSLITQHSGENLNVEPTRDNLAYVSYTSGSSGRPKGVAMCHGVLQNLMEWQTGRFPQGATTLQFASFSFDVSFQEVFATLIAGGTLILTPQDTRKDPDALFCLIEGEQIERVFVPPVVLQQLAQARTERRTSSNALRDVITAGEQLQITGPIEQWFTEQSHCVLHNHYGPSETHVVTTHTLQHSNMTESRLPPIGRPIANTTVTVVNERTQLTPVGIPGELLAGGACLARGYLRRPDLTAETFLPDPFGAATGARVYGTGDLGRYLTSGNLEFLGRRDQQVKIRGFRIEPGEIETVLSLHPAVQTAVVAKASATLTSTRQMDQLVGYIVPRPGSNPTTTELRAYLGQTLPEYMLPNAFVLSDTLPLTPTGKVDRKALPALGVKRLGLQQDYLPPRCQTEEAVAGIWREVLGLEQVGIHDNFFELGGHSLLATQVMSRVRKTLAIDLALRMLFDNPTVAGLAEVIDTMHWATATTSLASEEMDEDTF